MERMVGLGRAARHALDQASQFGSRGGLKLLTSTLMINFVHIYLDIISRAKSRGKGGRKTGGKNREL